MKDRRGLTLGIILISLGVIFLLDEIFGIDIFDLIEDFWPLILIFFGYYLIKKNKSAVPKSEQTIEDDPVEYTPQGETAKDEGDMDYMTLDEFSLLGDASIRVTSKNFRGGNIRTVIGDIHLNLSEIDSSPGEKSIELSSVIGDVHVILPKDYVYRIRGNSILGDISLVGQKSGGMFRHQIYRSDDYSKNEKQLNINISIVIGDIHVS